MTSISETFPYFDHEFPAGSYMRVGRGAPTVVIPGPSSEDKNLIGDLIQRTLAEKDSAKRKELSERVFNLFRLFGVREFGLSDGRAATVKMDVNVGLRHGKAGEGQRLLRESGHGGAVKENGQPNVKYIRECLWDLDSDINLPNDFFWLNVKYKVHVSD